MSTKKKLTILISCLCVVVVAAVITVVAVLAAANATIGGGGVSVYYTAQHVNATVTGEYKKSSDSTYTTLTTTDTTTENTLTFATDSNTTTSQSFDEVSSAIQLKSTESVEFKYIITNTSTSTDANETFKITLGDITGLNNFTLSFVYTTSSESHATDHEIALATSSISVAQGEVIYLYATLSITDTTANASFEGAIELVLRIVE